MIDRSESTDVWAEVVVAVEFFREGNRPGLTVWDALSEGMDMWSSDEWSLGPVESVQAWTDPDPLRTKLEMLLRAVADPLQPDGHAVASVLDAALRVWLDHARVRHNDGRSFASEVGDAARAVRSTGVTDT